MSKLEKVITFIEENLNALLLFSTTIVLFVNVIARYFFANASTWAEEAIRYAVIWVTFFGGSICAKDKMHIGIDIFVQMTSPGVRKVLLALAQVISASFTALLAYYGFQSFQLIIATGQRSPAMMMPMWLVYLAMPLGGIFMSIRFLQTAYAILTDKATGQEEITDGTIDISRL